MGVITEMLIEQANEDYENEVREWLTAKLGRPVSRKEVLAAYDDFELEQAFDYAMSKDD